MAEVIEVPRDRGKAGALFGLGVIGTLISVPLFWSESLPIVAPIFLLAVSVLPLLTGGWWLVAGRPVLRATGDGIWFGGGRVVPWTEVKQVYVGRFDVRAHGQATRTAAIAIDFASWRTMLRLPPMRWLGRILSVGDIDVSAGGENPSVLAARLDAMRNRALGHAGTGES